MYQAMARTVNHEAAIVRAYEKKCDGALKFAAQFEGLAWNGGYQMGLAIAGLELVPTSSMIERKHYWVRAPQPYTSSPDELPDWEDSWIVEQDVFNGGT